MTRTLGEPALKRGQHYSLHAFSGLPTTQVEERRTLVPARWSKMRTGLHKQLNSCPRDWIMVAVVAAHPHNTAWQFDKGEQLQKERGKKKKEGARPCTTSTHLICYFKKYHSTLFCLSTLFSSWLLLPFIPSTLHTCKTARIQSMDIYEVIISYTKIRSKTGTWQRLEFH